MTETRNMEQPVPDKGNVHVVPHPDGGWAARREQSERAISLHPTQADAISRAREVARNSGVELVIHRPDGPIRDSDSHGRDPFPPRDKK